VADVDGTLKRDAQSVIEALVAQITAPVRWEDVVRRLASEGVTTYVEVGAGTVLTGLVRKIDREAKAVSFGAPDDLAPVEALLGAPPID
jgi:[acyl-carrier-protein] S-malonyltransferase